VNKAVENFYEQLSNLAPKLLSGVNAIEMEISRKEEELANLREALKKAQTILYVVNPESKPKPRNRAGRATVPSNGKRVAVSEEKVEGLLAWLHDREKFGPLETFSGPEILANNEFDLMSEPTLRAALDVLHERGLITLDSLGSGVKGGRRKNYRLVVS